MTEEPKFKSASYRPCDLCPEPVHCWLAFEATKAAPCWGQVMIAEETSEGDKIHACQGHMYCWGLVADPENYEREP